MSVPHNIVSLLESLSSEIASALDGAPAQAQNSTAASDAERKLVSQMAEFSRILKVISQLEEHEQALKQKYVEEIKRLRLLLGEPTDTVEQELLGEVAIRQKVASAPKRAFYIGEVAQQQPSAPKKSRTTGTSADWFVSRVPDASTGPDLDIQLRYEASFESLVSCVTFNHAGDQIAAGLNKYSRTFQADTGRVLETFSDVMHLNTECYMRCTGYSPDDRILAVGAEDNNIKLWNLADSNMIALKGHSLDVYDLCFSPDGQFIASASGDKTVRVWHVETGNCSAVLGGDTNGPTQGVACVDISKDGRLLVCGSVDNTIRLYDLRTAHFLEALQGHTDSVYSVRFSHSGDFLLSGSLDSTLRVWDLLSSTPGSRCRSTLRGHSDFVLCTDIAKNDRWAFSGSKDRSVHVWDLQEGKAHSVLSAHQNSVMSIAMHDNKFVTGGGDGRMMVWDIANPL